MDKYKLTPRESEVAEWVGRGKNNSEIAIILGITSHTVKQHLTSVYKKLHLENRYQLILHLAINYSDEFNKNERGEK